MVDWNSETELVRDTTAFTNLMHVLLGLYIWEVSVTLDFDAAFIFRRKKFLWPLIFYFGGRYSMLLALIGVVIGLNVTTEINCQALFTFSQLFGNMAIVMSATNLSIRTMAMWDRKRYIVVPLTVALLGFAGVLLRGIIGVKDIWVEGAGCSIVSSQQTILRTIYIYGMSLDLIVLLLTFYKLGFGSEKSALMNLLLRDGLVYFLITFTANTIAVIFMMLNLNAVMAVIADVPAVVICTVASCRAVRRLSNHIWETRQNAELYRARTFGAHSYGQNTTIGTTGIDIRKEQEVRIEMDGYTNTNTTTSATVAVQSVDHATTGTDGKSFMDLEAQSHHDADAEDREIEFAKMKAYKPPEQW